MGYNLFINNHGVFFARCCSAHKARLTFTDARWIEESSSKLSHTNIKIKKDPQSGLGIYATEDILAGSIVLSEQPYLKVVCESTKEQTCALCFFQSDEDLVEQCECGEMWYCSAACRAMAAASGLHSKDECRCLSASI